MSRPTSPPPTPSSNLPAWLASRRHDRAGRRRPLGPAAGHGHPGADRHRPQPDRLLPRHLQGRRRRRPRAGRPRHRRPWPAAGRAAQHPRHRADEGGLPGVAWSTPAGADEPAPDDLPPQPPPPPEPTAPPSPEPVLLQPDTVEASGTAGPSTDGAGSTVTFEAGNLLDGQADTAWRVAGDGIGHTLSFRFDRPVHLTAIALLPGYAKVDPADGANRFTQNRRVSSASYTFDNGSSVPVAFSDRAVLQQVESTPTPPPW